MHSCKFNVRPLPLIKKMHCRKDCCSGKELRLPIELFTGFGVWNGTRIVGVGIVPNRADRPADADRPPGS